MKIHQFLPTLAKADAIGYETLAIQHTLRDWSFESEIYVRDCQPNVSKYCHYYKKYRPSEDDLIIFHFSIGSELSKFMVTLPTKKIMIYHNITPSKYLRGINETIAQILDDGKKELAELYDKFDLALGDSEYNRQELESFGFTNTHVLPLLYNFSVYNGPPTQQIIEKYSDNATNIIFVGKIYPHKKQEDIIKSFYCYKKFINPNSRLFLVGHANGAEEYQKRLLQLVNKLELKDVFITGFVNNKDLVAYYKIASVFMCMSEHEGFCVPLLESMFFKVPVIAFESTAIADTLNNSAILVKEKNYLEIAELIDLVVKDKTLRNTIVAKQTRRLEYFSSKNIQIKLKAYIESILQ